LLLLRVDGDVLAFNVKPQPVVNAYVLIGHPNQREKRNHVTTPVWKYQLETRNHQERRGDVMAQAVFAGKQIKKFAPEPGAAFALHLAEFLKFVKHGFMGKRPRDASHRYGKNKQGENLLVEGHAIRCRKLALVCRASLIGRRIAETGQT
jgi:hypothetical protein